MLAAMLAVAVAAGLSGCWLAAAQLAPVAVSAAEDVGAGVVHATAGAVGMARGESERAKDETRAREDAMHSEDSCEQLEVEVPGVIELRKGAGGAPEYRELQLSDSAEEWQWTPITYGDPAGGGWRPAVNFLQLNFAPPLGGLAAPATSNFLAYAPSQYVSAADNDRMVAMTTNFGKPAGTFTWAGRQYHYVVTRTLPCFPPPPLRVAVDSAPGS
jgi:hypothetical protein